VIIFNLEKKLAVVEQLSKLSKITVKKYDQKIKKTSRNTVKKQHQNNHH
jgi:hypothetical protein